MQEYFKILGLNPSATDEEIESAYSTLKEKYMKERFCEGEVGNQAARNLTKIETAYQEIKASRNQEPQDNNESSYYQEIEELIKNGNLVDAQIKLDNVVDRNAEFHYLQSHLFYKKNWINESKKQLEIAMEMEPRNEKYSKAYTKLREKIEYNNKQFQQGHRADSGKESPQMGGTDSNFCMDYCLTMCCMNLLCNMCCNCR